MIKVSSYDQQTSTVFLESDAEGVASQLTELKAPGVEDIALRYATQNGISIDGTMDLGGRNMRFYDVKKDKELSPSEAMRGDGPTGPVICRRLVKLAISSSSQSSIAQLPMSPKYETATTNKTEYSKSKK